MAGKAATLNELMGKGGSDGEKRKLSFDDLPDLLGEGMPKIEFSRVGRFRLINALKQRFGQGFRNLPGVSDIIEDFDEKVAFEQTIEKMKKLKAGRDG